jgi:primosomal protein N' (replication factor Y)
MLVPEISLTPLMVERFVSRFGERVAVLHSGLNQAEKYDEWRKINRKEVDIVIGARSAIFAPFLNLGIIIIDEEHELSYKQDSHPKYLAHDVAMWRSHYHNCPLVLGSATPSIETFSQTINGHYELLTLDERVNKQALPFVHLVDMTNERNKDGIPIFSNRLIDLIQSRINNDEQVVLLLNRRGYTPVFTCNDCGEVVMCPNCDISLTYHKSSHKLKCHYCNHQTHAEVTCDHCGSDNFIDYGYGTERVEEEILNLFDGAKVVRMDSDTTSRKGSHQKILDDFKDKKYNILLGTQMIAKGLDFPDVTLVGVINADTALNLPDYRSSELTFQLLSQVAGRAGRHIRPGEVVIQSMNPEHYSILFAKIHDYNGFFEHELRERKKIGYPPFYRLIKVQVSSKDYKTASFEVSKVAKFLKSQSLTDIKVLGPTPASIFKVNNVYRFGCIIKYRKFDELYPVLNQLKLQYKTRSDCMVDLDINPSRML